MLTLIQCLFHPSNTVVACKRPWSFCQKCRWQVTPKHTYTLDSSGLEWANYAAVQAECGNLSRNKLTHNPSGNTQLQSSQLAEPLWTDPGLKSGISLRKLISTLKKTTTTTKTQAGNELSNILLKILEREEKATTTATMSTMNVSLLMVMIHWRCPKGLSWSASLPHIAFCKQRELTVP